MKFVRREPHMNMDFLTMNAIVAVKDVTKTKMATNRQAVKFALAASIRIRTDNLVVKLAEPENIKIKTNKLRQLLVNLAPPVNIKTPTAKPVANRVQLDNSRIPMAKVYVICV